MNQESYTRNDLAAELSKQIGCSVEQTKITIEHFIKAVSGALAAGKKVEFRGFGVITVVRRKEKVGRNPKNPESGLYRIPPHNVVRFRAGRVLDAAINREVEAAVSA